MKSLSLFIQTILAISVAFTADLGVQATEKAGTHTVVIEGMKFVPDSLTVKPGDTIIWVNKDFFPHTATTVEKGFDSEAIQASGTWKHVATKKGTFPYICTLHPLMKASLTVE